MKAILFDFDGVIVDSEPVYAEVENELFSKMVPNWQRKFSEEIIGLDPHSTFSLLKNKHALKISEAEFREEYDKGYPMVYDAVGLTKKALEMLNYGMKHGVRMSIVSSTPKEYIASFLRKKDIAKFIEEIFSSAAGLFTVGYNTIDPKCPCDCLLSDVDDVVKVFGQIQ